MASHPELEVIRKKIKPNVTIKLEQSILHAVMNRQPQDKTKALQDNN